MINIEQLRRFFADALLAAPDISGLHLLASSGDILYTSQAQDKLLCFVASHALSLYSPDSQETTLILGDRTIVAQIPDIDENHDSGLVLVATAREGRLPGSNLALVQQLARELAVLGGS